MGDRGDLHDLRQKGHDAGIRGSSKMTEGELRQALAMVNKGEKPIEAKRAAKGWR